MSSAMAPHPNSRGFTLIELVIVIILLGILAGMLATIMRGPVTASIDVQRRMVLVDIAETALQRMTREIRLALPNSLRVSPDGQRVEFLHTVDGGRYRVGQQPGPPPRPPRLRLADAAGEFEVLGGLVNPGTTPDRCGVACLMVIFNTGQAGANAYAGDNTAAIQAITIGPPTVIEYSGAGGGDGFPLASPEQRFQIVDTPVMFSCEGDEIRRYSGYAISDPMPPPPGGGNLLIDRVLNCSFTFHAGSLERAGLLTLRITVTHPGIGAGGQDVTLVQQVHISNQP